jgi:hypothetical protein
MSYHVVYLSFEDPPNGRGYIGKHSCTNPYDEYLGSYSDETFNPTGKIILEYSNTEEGAILAEMRWQRVFQVAENPDFANKSYQTSTGFQFRERRTKSEEECRKLSESLKGERNPMYGRVGELNPMCGRKHPPEIIQLLEKITQERAKDPEWLKKVNKKGKKEKESTRQKKKDVVRGSWWTSETGEVKRSVECPGEGWEKRRGNVGLWWVNAQNESCQSSECPGEGWRRGRKWRVKR